MRGDKGLPTELRRRRREDVVENSPLLAIVGVASCGGRSLLLAPHHIGKHKANNFAIIQTSISDRRFLGRRGRFSKPRRRANRLARTKKKSAPIGFRRRRARISEQEGLPIKGESSGISAIDTDVRISGWTPGGNESALLVIRSIRSGGMGGDSARAGDCAKKNLWLQYSGKIARN